MEKCPYKIDNNDIAQKTLFACWFIKMINEKDDQDEPNLDTKEIYHFLKESGVTWSSFHNVCQFLTGSNAEPFVEQFVSNLPKNEFNLTSHDVLHSFGFARFFLYPEEMNNLVEQLEKKYGVN